MTNRTSIRLFAALLLAATPALVTGRAPTMLDPGGLIVGDNEGGDANNLFKFPDAFSLQAISEDDNTPVGNLIFSYEGSGKYLLNGVQPLGPEPAGITGTTYVDPPLANQLQNNDNDSAGTDANADTVTIRNNTLSPLAGSAPFPEPGTVGRLESEEDTVTLYASDGQLAGSRQLFLYSENNGTDDIGLFREIIKQDFVANPGAAATWTGGLIAGVGSFEVNQGLCMTPVLGSYGLIGYLSPPGFAEGPGYIPLVDKAVYVVRVKLTSTQTGPGLQPFWQFTYNNFFPVGPGGGPGVGNHYGGEIWGLEVASNGQQGVSGIGKYHDEFDFVITPNAACTEQWRGLIDSANSAFDPSVDAVNDMLLVFRILNGTASVNGLVDSGTICVKQICVYQADIGSINRTPVYTAPINSSTHAVAHDFNFGSPGGGTASIDDGNGQALFQLTGNYVADPRGSRKQLIYYMSDGNAGTFLNTEFYPVEWLDDSYYMFESHVRSDVGGRAGTTEGTDPVDLIWINMTVPTSEIGAKHYTQKGIPGLYGFYHAASPRKVENTSGQPQPYVGFIASGRPSTQPVGGNGGPKYIRGFIEFWNVGGLMAPLGTSSDGLDPLAVESFNLYTIDTDNLLPPADLES